jgi:hypothetical protein
MMFPKIKRVVNRKLLDEVKTRPCFVCRYRPTDPCHIISRGSGGPDEPYNVISLCRKHHQLHHSLGWFKMCEEHPFLKQEIYQRGFRFDGNKKLRRD